MRSTSEYVPPGHNASKKASTFIVLCPPGLVTSSSITQGTMYITFHTYVGDSVSLLAGGMDDRGVYAWQHSVTWPLSAAPIVISKEGAHSLHGIAKREERKSQVSYRVTPPKKKAVILINIQSDSNDGIHTKVLPSSPPSLLSPLIKPVLTPAWTRSLSCASLHLTRDVNRHCSLDMTHR